MGNLKYEYNVGDIHGVQQIMSVFRKDNRLHVHVKCIKCGKEKDMRASDLFSERTISCKCQAKTHGMSRTRYIVFMLI